MLSFSSLFKYTFKTKNKNVNLLLLLQFAVVIIGALWSALANSHFKPIEKWSQGVVMVGITSFIVILIYLFISIISNEKINSSQTWQLLPISSKKFYLVNLFTSILNAIYLVFMQVIMALVVLIPLTTFKEFRSGVGEIWHKIIENNSGVIFKDTLPIFLLVLLFLLLFYSAIYIFITTINFVSTLLMEKMSKNNTKISRFGLIVVLVIIIFRMACTMLELLYNINFFNTSTLIEWSQANIILLIIDSIFIMLNIWLLKNYHEGKEN